MSQRKIWNEPLDGTQDRRRSRTERLEDLAFLRSLNELFKRDRSLRDGQPEVWGEVRQSVRVGLGISVCAEQGQDRVSLWKGKGILLQQSDRRQATCPGYSHRHAWQDGSIKVGGSEFDLDNVSFPLLLDDDHKVHLPTFGDLHDPFLVLETPKVLLVSFRQSRLLRFETGSIVSRQLVFSDSARPSPDSRGSREQRDGIKVGLPLDGTVGSIQVVGRVSRLGRGSVTESDVLDGWDGQRWTGSVFRREERSNGGEDDIDHGVGGRSNSQGGSCSDPVEVYSIVISSGFRSGSQAGTNIVGRMYSALGGGGMRCSSSLTS